MCLFREPAIQHCRDQLAVDVGNGDVRNGVIRSGIARWAEEVKQHAVYWDHRGVSITGDRHIVKVQPFLWIRGGSLVLQRNLPNYVHSK